MQSIFEQMKAISNVYTILARTAMTLLVAVLATTAWAQTDVATEAALNSAIAAGEESNIRLTADITLNDYIQIGQSGTQVVTLDLNGHTLKRNLSEVDANGHVIEVFTNGTLTLKDGSGNDSGQITGGRANNGGGICNYGTLNFEGGTISACYAGETGGGIKNNSGATLNMSGGAVSGCYGQDCGGIYNADGGTLNITGGSINGNTSGAGGGGVVNYGTAYISGGIITGNHATTRGGGIWSNGTLNMTGGNISGNRADIEGGGIYNSGTLNMEGDVAVKDNPISNIYLTSGKKINVTGPITSGENSIGISMESIGVFTSRYDSSGTNANPFFSDTANSLTQTSGNEYAIMSDGYYECSWNGSKVVRTRKDIPTDVNLIYLSEIQSGGILPSDGYWYVAKGQVNISGKTAFLPGTVNLILLDGAEVTFSKSLIIGLEATLNIFCQSYGSRMGKLIAYGEKDEDMGSAGIGGGEGAMAGTINIHGGHIIATGGFDSAGIGGGNENESGFKAITIYDGIVNATGADYGSGIGYGDDNHNNPNNHVPGTIDIYGGFVVATGGKYGAGIGGGEGIANGPIRIYGGDITAQGGENGAGIGCGDKISGIEPIYFFGQEILEITINGGTVRATGGAKGAGIGGGRGFPTHYYDTGNADIQVTVNDGTVTARGGAGGAGIGAGSSGYGANVFINGGKTYAYGNNHSAGIGSGDDSDAMTGGNCTITGGYVYAEGNGKGAGIGGGEFGIGANVSITGGIVEAIAGDEASEKNVGAIGGYDSYAEHPEGTLEIGNKMKVTAGTSANATQPIPLLSMPVSACHFYRFARVEPCDHPEASVVINDISTHTPTSCAYCILNGTAENHTFGSYGECGICHLVKLGDDTDNSSSIEHWNGEAKAVFLSNRTLYKDGTWNTLCLPFALSAEQMAASPLAEATVKTLSSASLDKNTGTLTLNFSEPQNEIVAGTPYIVKWSDAGENVSNPLFRNVTINNANSPIETEDAAFVGTYSPVSIPADGDKTKLYFDTGNTLSYPNAAMNINAFRAWIQLPGVADSCLGNVNGDQQINVTDVTTLVDYILGNECSVFFPDNADVTADGEINVTDVTALVDIILHGSNDIQSVVVNTGDDSITYNGDGSSADGR